MQNTKRYLLFIHGAWHAAWCWHRVAAHLSEIGHKTLTPDLPGHGATATWEKTIFFNDYVSSITQLIKQQPEPVTLIGHSMAGLIISQVAENIPQHIQELIYLSAYIPQNNQSLISIAEQGESKGVAPFLDIDKKRQQIRLKFTAGLSDIFFNCTSAEDKHYALSRLQPQPLQPFFEKVRLGAHFHQVPKRSWVCRHDKAIAFNDQMHMSQYVTDNISILETDHAAYFSATDEIIRLI